MRSLIFQLPVWVFSMSALVIGVTSRNQQFAIVYVGLGLLGVSIGNVLTEQRRRIVELEKRLDALSADSGA
jgi:hypothetical protein